MDAVRSSLELLGLLLIVELVGHCPRGMDGAGATLTKAGKRTPFGKPKGAKLRHTDQIIEQNVAQN